MIRSATRTSPSAWTIKLAPWQKEKELASAKEREEKANEQFQNQHALYRRALEDIEYLKRDQTVAEKDMVMKGWDQAIKNAFAACDRQDEAEAKLKLAEERERKLAKALHHVLCGQGAKHIEDYYVRESQEALDASMEATRQAVAEEVVDEVLKEGS